MVLFLQVVDQDDLDDDYEYLGDEASSSKSPRRPSGEIQRPRSPSSPAALKTPGRNSRRVSLIPGEALEQAHATLALSALTQRQEPGPPPFFQASKDTSETRRQKPRVEKSKTTDDGGGGGGDGGGGDAGDGGTTANSSPISEQSRPARLDNSSKLSRSRSEQEWTNLRAAMAWYSRLRRIR
ncbi:hypothetical protein SK128_021697, partial [Halocaridina rubra]